MPTLCKLDGAVKVRYTAQLAANLMACCQSCQYNPLTPESLPSFIELLDQWLGPKGTLQKSADVKTRRLNMLILCKLVYSKFMVHCTISCKSHGMV